MSSHSGRTSARARPSCSPPPASPAVPPPPPPLSAPTPAVAATSSRSCLPGPSPTAAASAAAASPPGGSSPSRAAAAASCAPAALRCRLGLSSAGTATDATRPPGPEPQGVPAALPERAPGCWSLREACGTCMCWSIPVEQLRGQLGGTRWSCTPHCCLAWQQPTVRTLLCKTQDSPKGYGGPARKLAACAAHPPPPVLFTTAVVPAVR